MKYKVIAGATSEYEVYPKDVLSLKDTALAVKFDAIEKISTVIKNGTLQPYYFYKAYKNENDEDVLRAYKFKFIEVWAYEYKKKVDALFFLKRDVIKANILEVQEDTLMFPQENITRTDNAEKICLEIIKNSIEIERNYSIVYGFLFAYCACMTRLFIATSYFFRRILNKLRIVSATNGYTAELFAEELPIEENVALVENIQLSKKEKPMIIEFANLEFVKEEITKEKIQKLQFNEIKSLDALKMYLNEHTMTEREQQLISYRLFSRKVAKLSEIAEALNIESLSDNGKVQKVYRMNKSYIKELASIKNSKKRRSAKESVIAEELCKITK